MVNLKKQFFLAKRLFKNLKKAKTIAIRASSAEIYLVIKRDGKF